MELTFNSQIVDASVALNALRHFRAGEYEQAIGALQTVLDEEPQNWQARLMLAACYYKTNQMFAAQRAFRFVYEKSNDKEVRAKAHEALLATNLCLQRKSAETPAEFGGYVDRQKMQAPAIGWLD